jgi:hypothetical protein
MVVIPVDDIPSVDYVQAALLRFLPFFKPGRLIVLLSACCVDYSAILTPEFFDERLADLLIAVIPEMRVCGYRR